MLIASTFTGAHHRENNALSDVILLAKIIRHYTTMKLPEKSMKAEGN